ncbi:MAG TPA: hypothetical protein VGT78_00085 [Rhizomicrobium sp.]|nr:hypothetical protein [Rhizomicrobium sp.]
MLMHGPFAAVMGISWASMLLIYFLIFVLPVMQIIHKAGYTRAWVLIGFVPVVNLIFLWIFAFSRWPIENRVK